MDSAKETNRYEDVDITGDFMFPMSCVDPFHKGMYRYAFRNLCEEISGPPLNDNAYRFFQHGWQIG